MTTLKPALYGLTDLNTNRAGRSLWGKNQFNSTFPLALCLKMRDDGVRPVYVTYKSGNRFFCSDKRLAMASVVGRVEATPFYAFETSFEPYEAYVTGGLEKIDLVVHTGNTRKYDHPLEVKLTAVPDSTTADLPSSDWAPELVMRPISSAYAMLGVGHRLFIARNETLRQRVTAELQPINSKIRNWNNVMEITSARDELTKSFLKVLELIHPIQRPYLVQPVWRTRGASFTLEKKCFDAFVWSDVSIMAIPACRVCGEMASSRRNVKVSRNLREVARHVRALYDLCTKGRFHYDECYGGMGLDNQTDKSFSLSGRLTRKYLNHSRLLKPHYPKEILPEIILHGGEEMLKPERRLDMAVCASADTIFGLVYD